MDAIAAPPVIRRLLLARTWEMARKIGRNPRVRALALLLYYLGIIATLLVIYGRGDFETAPFVYQKF